MILLPDHSIVASLSQVTSISVSMNLNGINIPEIVEQTKAQLQQDKTLTPALKMSIELILMVVIMLANKLGLNSQNSSIPPSIDINRAKSIKTKSDRTAGGQKGRVGKR